MNWLPLPNDVHTQKQVQLIYFHFASDVSIRDLSATTPEDYRPPARHTVTFPIDSIQEQVTMPLLSDSSVEDMEVFEITIYNPSEGNLGEITKAKVYLYDPPSEISFLFLHQFKASVRCAI